MLLYKDIIKEDDIRLKQKSQKVDLPLIDEDIKLLEDLNEYLVNGYDEKLVEEYGLRPGIGISAVQIGVLKRLFVIMSYDEEGNFHHYGVINPRIISHSEEFVFLGGGEGCLSIERETEGFVHRYKRITVKAHFYDFDNKTLKEDKIKLQNFLAIVFQHEFDHLNGILFTDRIDKLNPLFIPENSKPIRIDSNLDESL